MNQEHIDKLVNWIKANRNYSVEQLRQSALQGGSSKEEFDAAFNIVNTPTVQLKYNGVGRRFLALFVDLIFFSVLFWLFTQIFSVVHRGGCDLGCSIGSSVTINKTKTFYGLCGLSAQLYYFIIGGYNILLEWSWGGTLGKLLFGMRVIKSTGEPLDFKSAIIRNFLRIVDLLPFLYLVGAISIWTSKTKQRVGDKLAKTVVVSKNSIK